MAIKEGRVGVVEARRMIREAASDQYFGVTWFYKELGCPVQAYVVRGTDWYRQKKDVYVLYYLQNGKDGYYFSEYGHADTRTELDRLVADFKSTFSEDCYEVEE